MTMRTCEACGFENAEPGKSCALCGAAESGPLPGSSAAETLELTRTSVPRAPSAPQADSLLGRVYGQRYRVEALLGAGGMVRVYRVTDLESGTEAALKVVRPEDQDDPGRSERFRRETSILSRLQHEAVPRVLGGGEEGGELYFVSELVRDRT